MGANIYPTDEKRVAKCSAVHKLVRRNIPTVHKRVHMCTRMSIHAHIKCITDLLSFISSIAASYFNPMFFTILVILLSQKQYHLLFYLILETKNHSVAQPLSVSELLKKANESDLTIIIFLCKCQSFILDE